MKRGLAIAIVANLLVGVAGVAATMPHQPAYIAAAIADKNRPAEDTARDADRKPAAMLEFAGIKPGSIVVDLIPGKGYFTRIFAAAVGDKGHVYSYEASEFDGVYKSHHVEVPTGTVPGYPNATYIHAPAVKMAVPEYADVIWTSQNYHDLHDSFAGPVDIAAFNKAVYAALKPGGVFVVLDHAALPGSGLAATDTLHRIDPAAVKTEVTAAGFKFVGESKVLRNPKDPHTALVFDKSIRGHTDQFIYKFQKPRK